MARLLLKKHASVFAMLLLVQTKGVGTSFALADIVLYNTSFEEKGEGALPAGWQLMPNREGKGVAVLDDSYAHSGRYSLRLGPNKNNTAEGFGVFTTIESSRIRGKKVTVSGFARLENMGKNPAGLMIKTDRDNWIVFPQRVQKQFFNFSQTFSAGNVSGNVYVFFIAGGAQGNAWLDTLSITVSEESRPGEARARIAPSSKDPFLARINTPGWQDSAFITPDGRNLYFAYMPYTHNDLMDLILGRKSEKDVIIKGPVRPGTKNTMRFETYVVTKDNNNWGNPVNINLNGLNGGYSPYAAKTSFDGSELYYVLQDHPGGFGSGDIYISKKKPDGNWDLPENAGPGVNTPLNEDTPFARADGKALYFARNVGDALGWEIMVSQWANGKWGVAAKLKPPINQRNPHTTANHQPFITADGKEFYFTRIQQLYKSTMQPDGRWGTPSQIFPQLPVSGHASVTADGRYLYFLTAKDQESLARSNWSIWFAEREPDGHWGNPRPID